LRDDRRERPPEGVRLGDAEEPLRRVTSCSLPSGARIIIGGVTMKLVKG
jgi:hypothetical protein